MHLVEITSTTSVRRREMLDLTLRVTSVIQTAIAMRPVASSNLKLLRFLDRFNSILNKYLTHYK